MSWIKGVLFNCKKATFLIEKKGSGKIAFKESIELRIHLLGCSMCRLYNRQSRLIDQMVHELFISSKNTQVKLDENFKKELQAKIDEELRKN